MKWKKEGIEGDREVSKTSQVTDISVKAGSKTFKVRLVDDETAIAFRSRLPMTLKMEELNGNEKFQDLSKALPQNATNPGKIEKGDLMLYGSRTVVLFYKTFTTSYLYTRIGNVTNPSHLADVLGSGDVEVTFMAECL